MKNQDMLEWLRVKLADAEKARAAREQGEDAWRSGSDRSWKAVGCNLNKSERLKLAEIDGRIANKCRRDVEMFNAVINTLTQPK